jgi:hypothetical protein
VFNIRYYKGATGHFFDGIYELATEEISKSYNYGVINLKRMKKNETVRASARISINQFDDFVKYDVELNAVPINNESVGKDVIVDWYMLDGFNTSRKLYVDANGL